MNDSHGEPDLGGLGGLFEDLEQQAAGMHLAERDAELADRARGEYAAVSFASRVHASLGRTVQLTLTSGEVVEGALVRAGADWCEVVPVAARGAWLVPLGAVAGAYGMSARAVPEAARPLPARLSFGSALHRLTEESPDILLHHAPAGWVRVRVARIGADFVEVVPVAEGTPTEAMLVPFSAVFAARSGIGR